MEKTLFASRIRLRHIQCFVSVAQERTLGKAAQRLRLSQPAVTKTLAELEELLAARLFDRGRQGARLTGPGEVFMTHALAVLEALEAAGKAIGAPGDDQVGTLRIGALPTVAPDLLPAAMAAFRRIHPGMRLEIRTAANAPLLDSLKSGDLDFALGRMADPQAMPGLSFELLYAEPLALAARAGHPLSRMRQASLADVVAYPLIVSTRGTIPRHNTENYLRSRGIPLPANCTETLSVSLGRAIALQSDSVWFAPLGAIRADCESGALVRLPVSTQGSEEPVGLLHRSEGRLAPAAADMMGILREAAATRR